MVLPVAAQWVLGLAAFIGAAGVVWSFGRKIYRIDAAMPVLLQIATQFDPEVGGKSLYQRIVAIEAALTDIKDDTHKVVEKINGTGP